MTVRIAITCFLVVGLSVWIAPAQPEATVKILSPLDQCALESSKVEIVASATGLAPEDTRALAVLVDGQPVDRVPAAHPTVVARVELAPGEHTISVGPESVRVWVRGDDDPPEGVRDWPVMLAHPGGDDGWHDCASCHVTSGEGETLEVRDLVLPDACLTCHSPADFEHAHSHPLMPIAGCKRCHATHGATVAPLLRAPARKLCAECHE